MTYLVINDCSANGDANGDGIVNVVDIVATVSHIVVPVYDQ